MLGSSSSYMTLQLLHSEFPHIWGKFDSFFIGALVLLTRPVGGGWSGGKTTYLLYLEDYFLVSCKPCYDLSLWRYYTKYAYLYKEYYNVCPFVGIGTLPTPLSPASVPLPPEPGGGAHSPGGEGLGESQFRGLEKKLSTLPALWDITSFPNSFACILPIGRAK